MDPSFFGLDGHPFETAEEAEDAYLSEVHASLITELKAGLKAPHGITLLIGEEGTGKTTLVRRFADGLADSCTVAYLPTTGPGLRHLLTEIIEQLGGSPPPAGDEHALLECLGALARARAEHGRTTLVVVDDAHELPAKTIERVGRLFGDDPADPSMLHVILVGRGELLDRMNAANDRTILKHLVQVCRMDPIGPEESFRYIADRIAKVGGIVDKLFTEAALRLIVKRANGNPARIDAICRASLEQAAESGEQAVGAETVDLACMGVEGFSLDGKPLSSEGDSDALHYIFGEDEDSRTESNGPRKSGRPAASNTVIEPSGGTKKPVKGKKEQRGGLADIASAVVGRFGSIGDGRRRLAVWGLGLVAVLAGFAAAMTRDGDDMAVLGRRVDEVATAKPAAKAAAKAEPAGAVALPATAVRTTKLVVKRDGEPTSPVKPAEGATQPTPPVHAAPVAGGKPAAGAVEPTRPRVQSPPYDPAATAKAAEASGSTAPKPAAPQQPPAPATVAAATAAGTDAAAKQQAEQKTAPKQLAAATAPKAPPAKAAPSGPAVAAATSKAAATATAGKYTVQVGAFSSQQNAEAVLTKMAKGYKDGQIVVAQVGGKSVYRVVSGAFATKSEADVRARTLTENGFSTYIRTLP